MKLDVRPHMGRLVVAAALAVVAAGWLSRLQTDITAGDDTIADPTGMVGPLMDDSGELAVAWHTWGVAHPPGYPLANLVGNLLTPLFEAFGASPAAAASLVSFTCALGALALLARIVAARDATGVSGATGMPGATGVPGVPGATGATGATGASASTGAAGAAAACAVLLPAFGTLVWLYAVVAEVYALGLLLAFAVLTMALAAGSRDEPDRAILALGLTFGLAIGHHRTLVLLAPAVAAAAWPVRRRCRAWLGAGGLAMASGLVYLYLPLAAAAGSPWVYGRSPATWDGFLDAVLAREYTAQLAPPTAPADVAAALAGRVAFLAAELTPAGLALAAFGLALALARASTRRRARVLALVVAGYLFAPVGQYLLIGTHLMLMVAAVAMGGAWGLGVGGAAVQAPTRVPILAGALAVTLFVAFGAWSRHAADVTTYARDPGGRHLIDAVAALDEAAPAVVESWSPRYFALAYGKLVTGEIAHARLVDARGDLEGLAQAVGSRDPPFSEGPAVLYTTPRMLLVAPPERWSERLGGPVALESAGDALVAVRTSPRIETRPGDGASSSGDPADPNDALAQSSAGDIALVDLSASIGDDGDVLVRAEWLARRAPTVDYHVFVHITDRPAVRGPDDILAQGDRPHPVHGFYPTSRWRVGERVRDDYRIELPADGTRGRDDRRAERDRPPRRVEIGLYTVAADGAIDEVLREGAPVTPNDPNPPLDETQPR